MLAGCAATSPGTKPLSVSPPQVAPTSGGDVREGVLAELDGVAISQDELGKEVRARLEDFASEAAQRRLHLLWVGVEDIIAERILEKEAKRRGVTVEVLREKEVLSKVEKPKDEEVRQFYEQNAARIGAGFDEVAAEIKHELFANRVRSRERAFVDRLREQSTVTYSLPVPELPRARLAVGEGPSSGPADAKVVIVIFSDFECPYCARAGAMVHELVALYPNTLRFEFRDYPLGQHGESRAAAEAARCADEQGKFWEYHDVLFANARALGPDDLRHYAEQVGLESQAFEACLASRRPKEAVASSIALGKQAGIDGTPAIYINGIKLIGVLPLPLVTAIIDRELAAKSR